ncbi:MAG: SGNH/GDSL hydrolase family protein [Lachnospiraceae bacterium]|nr:SGNH/GDSL hydrolase family protein [Lachnospiraceae bacterium]
MKKRILSLLLALIIASACVVEAWMIRALRVDNEQLKEQVSILEKQSTEMQAQLEDTSNALVGKLTEVKVHAFVPKDLYVAQGLTLEVYNNTVISGVNLDNYDVYWDCQIGDCMSDKFHVYATEENVGDYPLTMHLFDLSENEILTVSSTLHVVQDMLANGSEEEVTMVTIGDSLSAGTHWLEYTRQKSGERLTHLGTMGEEGVAYEAIPGITPAEMLTGTSAGLDSPNSFTNPATGSFDWAYYKEQTGYEPKFVQVFLGTNGLAQDPANSVSDISNIVEQIHSVDPDVRILVTEPIFCSYQDGFAMMQNNPKYVGFHGTWALGRAHMIGALAEALDKEFRGKPYVTLIPASVSFDRVNGFEGVELAVNPHSDIGVMYPSQGVHPSDDGYDQIGDVIYSVLCYRLAKGD